MILSKMVFLKVYVMDPSNLEERFFYILLREINLVEIYDALKSLRSPVVINLLKTWREKYINLKQLPTPLKTRLPRNLWEALV